MVNRHKILYVIIPFLLISLLVFSSSVVFGFYEDFTGAINNPSSWVVENEAGLSYTANSMILSSNTETFPYLHTSNPGFIHNTSQEVRFRYISSGSKWGDGITFTDSFPQYGYFLSTELDYINNGIFYIWHDSPPTTYNLQVFSTICSKAEPLCSPGLRRVYSSIGTDGNWYRIKVVPNILDLTYNVFLENTLIFESAPTLRTISNLWIGHPSILSSAGTWPTIEVDYVDGSLDSSPAFPFLSQINPLWGSVEYDTAHLWAPQLEQGIDRWGCALTSTAMMLRKFGVKDLSGNDVRPDTLNTWLKSVDDGYIGPGLINWLAITRYAKDRLPDGRSLEFERSYDAGAVELPAILGLPGHFVVAHDEESTNWIINDPARTVGNTTLPMSSTIRSVNRYVPSSTDLSYMMFTTPTGVTTTLTGPSSLPIPLVWTEEYLTNDLGGLPSPSLKMSLIPKPSSGKYRLGITNTNLVPTQFTIYLYDKDGRFNRRELVIPPGESYYDIDFDALNSAASQITFVDITAPSTPEVLGFKDPNLPCGALTMSGLVTTHWTESSDNVGVTGYDYLVDYPLPGGSERGERQTTFSTTEYRESLNEGSHTVKVRARDLAGNTSAWSNLCEITRDSTAPNLIGKSPFSGWYATPQIAVFSYADLHLLDDYIDPSCIISTEGFNQVCSLTSNVCDKAGNCNNDPQTSNALNLDQTAPVSTFMLPPILNSWNGKIDGVASDNVSGVAKVELEIILPGGAQYVALTNGTTAWNYTIPSVTDGKYLIRSRATDIAGNIEGWSSERQITLDTQRPDTPRSVSAHDWWQRIWVSWHPVKDVRLYRVYIGTTSENLIVGGETRASHWISEVMEPGPYYVSVVAIDKAGNESALSNPIPIVIKRTWKWWK